MPRPINEQVVVITGASSGIGRETALEFGRRRASVVLAARNETALNEVAKEIEALGGQALPVITDVAVWEDVQRLAEQAVDRFGRIDTWVNNAAVSTYGAVEDLTVEEIERVLRVNLLGQVYGVKAVLPHLKGQNRGTIINVSSEVGERAIPLQAPYSASKHGVKGFTESLRLELKHEQSGVNVTLILPASINTPFFVHSRSKLGVKPKPPPPVYQPEAVAEAIVYAAEHPLRDVYVGGASKMMTLMQRVSPSLTDRFMLMRGMAFEQQRTDEPDDREDTLFAPSVGTGSSTGEFGDHAQSRSIYTEVVGFHPNLGRALAAATLVGTVVMARRVSR
jgi:short-subunit dehydrogenase